MNTTLRSTGTLLGGLILIFFLSAQVLAEPHPNASERLKEFKDIASDLCKPHEAPDLGQLKIGEETINFPWAMKYIPGIGSSRSISISRQPSEKDIMMNSSNSTAKVDELSAINSLKSRDLLYNDSYKNESQDQKFSSKNREPCGNYLEIDVSGITVSAINTMKGGNALATSNIIINPVQRIDFAPEVEEKLK